MLASAGPGYKALIFAAQVFNRSQDVIPTAAVDKVHQFSQAGLPIFIIGNLPNETIPATASEAAFQAAVRRLEAGPNIHHVPSVDALPAALAGFGVAPRTSVQCSSGPVYNVRRSDPASGTEYLFFYNDQSVAAACQVKVATSGSVTPSLYDAYTGTQESLPGYTRARRSLSFPLTLQANQTAIVALSSAGHGNHPSSPSCASTTQAAPLSHTNLTIWNIGIEDWHAPTDRFQVETAITVHNFTNHALVPWTELGAGFDAVSGVGRYTTTLTVPSRTARHGNANSLRAILHLGPVIHTMRAHIDGQRLPAIDPTNPVLDITQYISSSRSGKKSHELMIEVTTPLFNRVKADADEIMVWGSSAALLQPLYASEPPMEYGLVGPVYVEWFAGAAGRGSECHGW